MVNTCLQMPCWAPDLPKISLRPELCTSARRRAPRTFSSSQDNRFAVGNDKREEEKEEKGREEEETQKGRV